MAVVELKIQLQNNKQTDIDYLCHNKICTKSKFCGLFILLLDTAFKSPNGKLEYTILPYIENVQTVSSIKVQFLQHKAQLHNLVLLHVPYTVLLLIPFWD